MSDEPAWWEMDDEAIRANVLADTKYILKKDELGDSLLVYSVANGRAKLVEFLLEQGADPNQKVDDGYTCLLCAVEAEDPEASLIMLKSLVAAGADLSFTGGINGWTPLHMAANRGYLNKVRYLLGAGSAVDLRTPIDGGYTPLMEAAGSGNPEVVKILLEHGADPELRDEVIGRTPMEMARDAAKGPDPEVIKILQELPPVNPDELCADMDLNPEERTKLMEQVGEVDLVKTYRENSQATAEQGDHAGVIKVLEEFGKK